MTRSPSRRRSATLLFAAVMIGQACGEPSQPSASGPLPSQSSATAQPSLGPFEPLVWPPDGDAPCDQVQPPDPDHGAYTGSIRRIRAVDAATVEIELCSPDAGLPARLAMVPFAINDTAWLESRVEPGGSGEQAIVRAANGTGPYRLDGWNRGTDVSLVRNDDYWGALARNERLIVRWREDPGDRIDELRSGSVDGVDDAGPSGIDAVAGDIELTAVPRAGLNVFYVGFNNTYAPFDKAKVRLAIALGIDRERIVETLYPPGSEVASHFSPCAIEFGCAGDPWYDFNPASARQLLAEAGYPDGFETTIQYRDVPRPYLPDPTAVASELQAQLLANLNITAELEVLPEETFLTTVDEGRADGIHLLGRSASVPEVSSLLDPHFGAGASSEFGKPIGALVDALAAGAATIEEAARTTAYADANNAIRANVPMIPIAHAGSLAVFRADVGQAVASPMRTERFAAMTPGDRRQLVWLMASEPEGLYCADESTPASHLVCAQLVEGLFGFAPDGASVVPSLATACEPVPELTTWTCSLRTGVVFHDGTTLDANDVVLSFAAQWDAEHPLHAGREGRFRPFVDTFGGLLNPPA
ncbi:MAG: ABC transporter substrate-binding protein [Chloroflexota bacterium]